MEHYHEFGISIINGSENQQCSQKCRACPSIVWRYNILVDTAGCKSQAHFCRDKAPSSSPRWRKMRPPLVLLPHVLQPLPGTSRSRKRTCPMYLPNQNTKALHRFTTKPLLLGCDFLLEGQGLNCLGARTIVDLHRTSEVNVYMIHISSTRGPPATMKIDHGVTTLF